MRTRRFSTPSVVVSVFFIACVSVVPALAVAAAARADIHSVNPFDTVAGRDYHSGRATATAGFHSTYQWTDTSREQREKVNPNPWPSVDSGPDRARQVLELPKAGKILARCRALGMVELPEQAFELSEPDGSSGPGYFVVPMINPRGDRFATAMLYREEDGSVLAMTVDTATNELTELVSADDESDVEEQAIKFNKKKWADCFVATCGPCIAGCAFTGPLWLKCTGSCCGVAAAVCVYIAMKE
ncbi:MAG: hypothetical protein NTX17_01135 [Candidatus Eisenbacteria bacterium]|nr:hypothetical protein [Candidatus Eisenbacteria bacterium]